MTKTYKRVPTGLFVTQVEAFCAANLFGQQLEYPTPENRKMFETFMESLSVKYGYDWKETEIAPTGERIHLVKVEEGEKEDEPSGVG